MLTPAMNIIRFIENQEEKKTRKRKKTSKKADDTQQPQQPDPEQAKNQQDLVEKSHSGGTRIHHSQPSESDRKRQNTSTALAPLAANNLKFSTEQRARSTTSTTSTSGTSGTTKSKPKLSAEQHSHMAPDSSHAKLRFWF